MPSTEEKRLKHEEHTYLWDGFRKEADSIIKDRFIGFTEDVNRIRRNLLIFVTIAITYKLSGACVTSLNFFGLVVEGWKTNFIEQALCFFITYHVVHFTWCIYEYCESRNIRINGKQNFIVNLQTRKLDYLSDSDKSMYIDLMNQHTKLEKSPFYRWLCIEAGLPITLSLWAFYLLIPAFWGG
ncbi:MAG: hypothetical protein K0U39_08235 [Alphaproteobacteria bacterium]|nr:hypothetical protein [Alphaproteobacteria bacterium]